MVWLSIVSLAVGVLLAHRFKVLVLIPATLIVCVIVFAAAGLAQFNDLWSALLTIGVTSVGMQAGYFVGMVFQHRLRFSWNAGLVPFFGSMPYHSARERRMVASDRSYSRSTTAGRKVIRLH